MSIATEKQKAASERFMLVKITPARYIVDDLASIGGSQYQVVFPFSPISSVTRNGIALSKVTTLAGNDQYAFVEATKTLTVQLAAAPSTTNVVIAFYDLFYTGGVYRYHPEDPESAESANNPTREWRAQLDKYPGVTQTIKNISEGILTFSASSISLVNDANEFEDYLTDNDSFSNKNVEIWQCISSISNVQRVFVGKVKSVSIDNTSVTLSILDPFSKFKSSAYFADTDDEAIFQRIASSFLNLNPIDNGKPVRYWTAHSSHTLRVTRTSPFPYLKFEDAPSCVCANADLVNEPALNNNRSYYLCRVGPSGLKTLDFGSTGATAAYLLNARFYKITGGNLYFGDQFLYSGEYYMVFYAGADFSYSGTDYNLIVACTTALTTPPANLASVTPAECPPGIYHDDANSYISNPFWWGVDYTYGWANTRGGNKFIFISLGVNAGSPETNWGIDPIDPNSGKLRYVVQPADAFTHGEFISKLCGDAGISVNAASFAQADSDLSANVHISIPNINETTYRTTAEYIQDVLKSTMGYLTINSDSEAEYHLLAAPSAGDDVDDINALAGSYKSNIDYNDITPTIIANNPHVPVTDGEAQAGRSIDYKSMYLHEMNVTYELIHSLDSIATRITDIAALRAVRRRTYRVDVATQLIDAKIGDDITYKGSNLKIIDINKNSSKISIEADDLKGL